MDPWADIAAHIGRATGAPFQPTGRGALGGGCISAASRLSDGERSFFVKVNDASRLDMFEAEREGLEAIGATATLRVPRPVCAGLAGGRSFLVLEHIELGRSRAGSAAEAGRGLAAMHRHTARAFGWDRDNTIGATPQPNPWTTSWLEFWREHRLGFQLSLAAGGGGGGRLQRLGERLLVALPALLTRAPAPSLLHGDLWGGNIGYAQGGEPVVFDPAVYYGDREADLAMTELFGGFAGDFYAAYREAWPLDPGYSVRRVLYNLYHVLNHLNLFGGGYRGQAEDMMERLLAEVS
jgi:fructosamine-3-kinase